MDGSVSDDDGDQNGPVPTTPVRHEGESARYMSDDEDVAVVPDDSQDIFMDPIPNNSVPMATQEMPMDSQENEKSPMDSKEIPMDSQEIPWIPRRMKRARWILRRFPWIPRRMKRVRGILRRFPWIPRRKVLCGLTLQTPSLIPALRLLGMI
jgi:hypothetical protein